MTASRTFIDQERIKQLEAHIADMRITLYDAACMLNWCKHAHLKEDNSTLVTAVIRSIHETLDKKI